MLGKLDMRDLVGRGGPRWLKRPELDALLNAGWDASGPLNTCATCKSGTPWLDPEGQPRHPWCPPVLTPGPETTTVVEDSPQARATPVRVAVPLTENPLF